MAAGARRSALTAADVRASTGKTRQEVAKKLAAALKARQDGLPLPAERQTVGRFLVGWLEAVRPSLRPRMDALRKPYPRPCAA